MKSPHFAKMGSFQRSWGFGWNPIPLDALACDGTLAEEKRGVDSTALNELRRVAIEVLVLSA
jgi:hypothetical protein